MLLDSHLFHRTATARLLLPTARASPIHRTVAVPTQGSWFVVAVVLSKVRGWAGLGWARTSHITHSYYPASRYCPIIPLPTLPPQHPPTTDTSPHLASPRLTLHTQRSCAIPVTFSISARARLETCCLPLRATATWKSCRMGTRIPSEPLLRHSRPSITTLTSIAAPTP